MSEINLSSAVRTSLTSLQATADLLTTTQERLATGNRVNSALDDPTAFFTASALNNRASDLSTLLDAQGQAIRVVEVADDGITAIQDLVDSARAQATAALQTDDPGARAEASAAFDDILGQIEELAGDASFNGTNLLEGDNLQVVFNEDGSANLTVEGVDFTDASAGLGLNRQNSANGATLTGQADANLTFANLGALDDTADIVISDGTTSVTISAAALAAADDAGTNDGTIDATELQAAFDTLSDTGDISSAAGSLSSTAGDLTVTVGSGAPISTAGTGPAGSTAFNAGTGANFADDATINAALSAIDSALGTLRSSAASLGSDLSTIQIRQDFTSNLINTLEAGAGDLTLADLNEEGANLLTLQTRQQLASTSLSFATQADQSVLSLF